MVLLSARGKEEIQDILSEAVDTKRTPGLVFGSTSTEKELHIAHAGPRDFGDPKSEPMTLDSIFWICSQTKMIISIGIFQLIDAGKLQLDTPASKFLPELANPVVVNADSTSEKPSFRPATEEITIKHLLNHSSGISYELPVERVGTKVYHLPHPCSAGHDQKNPVPHFFNLLKGVYPSQPLKFEPGSSFAYGYGSDCLGFIIERISGQNLEEYFKKHIFSPLGITSASFYLTPELKKKAVPLVFREPDGKIVPWADQLPLIEQDPQKVRLHQGSIGLYFSMRDYLMLLRHLLQVHAGSAQNPILTRASLKTFFQPTLTSVGEKALEELVRETDYQWSTALCVNTADVERGRKKGSAWWYGWAGTYHFMDPETGVAVVFGSQLIPRRDAEIGGLWKQLERAFYKGLTSD